MNDDPASVTSNEVVAYLDKMFASDTETLEVRTGEWKAVRAEIARLTRELEVQKAVVDLAYVPHRSLVESRDALQKRYDSVNTERDRLLAALEEILECYDDAAEHGDDGPLAAPWGIAQAALSGEPASAHETKERRCRECKETWIEGDEYCRQCGSREPPEETPPDAKRAYYETHEPPHCPTCDCGVPDGICTCRDVLVVNGRCTQCRRPIRASEKAGERPRVQPPKFCAVDGCYNRVADDQEVCDSCSQNGSENPTVTGD